MKWTKEQEKVINSRGGNLLVSAAAGSGKTAVLVKRIIDMVTDESNPMNIDELLVVTFTNAAAAEMKERITEAITKKLDEEPHNKHVYQQLNLMNHASITTLHSFCLDVIRRHFHMLDLDPQFRLADETEVLLIKNDVLGQVLENFYEDGEEAFFELVEAYGGIKQDSPLEELVLNLYDFTRSYPWPERWLQEHSEVFNIETVKELNDTPWVEGLMDYARAILTGIRQSLLQLLEMLQLPGAPIKLEPKFQEDLMGIDDLLAMSKSSYGDLQRAISEFSLQTVRVAGKELDPILKVRVSDLRKKRIKEPLDKLREDLFFKSPERLLKDIQAIYPLLKTLNQVVLAFSEGYQQIKKEKGLLDFSDLEHIALSLLMEEESTQDHIQPTSLAASLQKKYKEILVDEYQDSNMVQEILIRCVSKESVGEPNVFMVGDVKQSIYRFRMAKPELFVDKYETYGEEGDYRLINLSKNFRSRENILEGTNYIFKHVMNRTIGEIIYDDQASLHVGAPYKEVEKGNAGGNIEVHLLDMKLSEEDEDHPLYKEMKELTAIEAEAKLVTMEIEKLMDPRSQRVVYDKGEDAYRPLEYKDIVVLLRATSRWANTFVDELATSGIPAYGESNTGYFDAIEVKTVLNLLKIIDNPKQDLPLIAILRSPIVGLKADDLVRVRTNLEEGTFYDAMECFVEGELDPSPLGLQLAGFMDSLKKWREQSHYLSLHEFIWKLYMETDYFYYVTAMPDGNQRRANLEAFLEKAIKFENSSFSGLFNFLHYTERIRERNGDFGAAKVLGPNENIVRVMSIHKSKGLEFPVVILAGMGKGFNTMDQKQQVLLHQDLGFGPRYVDSEKRVTSRTLPQIAIRQKMKMENLSEELRILYVAFTRAREKLILTGTVKDIDKNLESWAMDTDELGHVPSFQGLQSKNYLDFIMPVVLRHEGSSDFRDRLELSPSPITDGSHWETHAYRVSDLIKENTNNEEKSETTLEKTIENIQHRLEWHYEKEALSKIPIKVTVSEIKKQSMEDQTFYKAEEGSIYEDLGEVDLTLEDEVQKPQFMEEEVGFTPAEKGTIFHQVMLHLDLTRINTYDEIKDQIYAMIEEGILTEEQSKTIYLKNIYEFGKSDLFKKIIKSKKLEREIPFVLAKNAKGVYEDLKNIQDEEYVLIQGVIDGYFEEEDGLVLYDFKTDRYENEQEMVLKYKKQLDLYEEALKGISNKAVKGKYLYLSSTGKTVKL